jgi:hypothetical protein
MSWIESISDWIDLSYYETGLVLLLLFLCCLFTAYTICKGLCAPCIAVCNCLQCCLINPLCNACFGRASKNKYVSVSQQDNDESHGPMV